MMQWQIDYLKAFQKSGMDFMWQPANNMFDLYIKMMLDRKFMGPAKMIARGAEMETFMKQFSLNGIKVPTICKP